MNRRLALKLIAGTLVGTGAVSGLAVGLWQAHTFESQDVVQQDQAVAAPVASPPLLPTNYRPVQLEDASVTYGAGHIQKELLSNYAYRLSGPYALLEQNSYTAASVEEQVRDSLLTINDANLPYEPAVLNETYNFVQAFNQNNADHIVAWKTEQAPIVPYNDGEYALIYLTGGPVSDVGLQTFQNLGTYHYWRTFTVNEAQFDLVPKQLVGAQGAASDGNYYFDRLRSSDKSKLQEFKDRYDQGQFSESAAMQAIGGDLDLQWSEVCGAASLATGIVAAARVRALVSQLTNEGYSRISINGLSYGMNLGLETMLFSPTLIDDLYKVTLGENSIAQPPAANYYNNIFGTKVDYVNDWNRYFYDLAGLVDIRPWVNKLLAGPEGAAFRQKVEIHNAKDDPKFPTQWVAEQKYWTGQNVPYHLYEKGGHSVFWSDLTRMAGLVGLKTNEARYWDSQPFTDQMNAAWLLFQGYFAGAVS